MQRPQKNNNPFALMQDKPSPWKGLIGSADDGFLQFENPVYGARAGFINLVNVYLKKGLNTIEKIFPVYAPLGHGNNIPEDYIKRVVKLTGIPRNQKISSKDDIYKLGLAIVTHEEGNFWMSLNDFNNGFNLAMSSSNLSGFLKTSGISIGIVILFVILLTFLK